MEEVSFRTNILLKNIIGKDLITDDNLAVLELVKNSFDAGASEVYIEYCNILHNDDPVISNSLNENRRNNKADNKIKENIDSNYLPSRLIIRDNGCGMDEYDLVYKWLNIAYSEKKNNHKNNGRIQAGNKGVGRFSCDRLGKYLTLYSRKKNSTYNKLFIDWTLFETEGAQNETIQDVKFTIEQIYPTDFETITNYKGFESGTILEISLLRETWTPDKILKLKRELEKFINPNQIFSEPKFDIYVIANEYLPLDEQQSDEIKKINGRIENKIFSKLNFKSSSITSVIDTQGESITTTLQDRGTDIFTLKEHNSFSELKDVKITIYYLNPYAKRYFTNQTGMRSVDFGSIFLFINGFRVPPYGDDGDDWLGLEIRKGQGFRRYLGTREIVGRIEISNNQENFIIISNRSGVVNNTAFEQLTKSTSPYGFFYKTLKRLERFVIDGIAWDKEGAILSKESDFGEKYKVDDLTRSKRILSVVNNIIETSETNVISLSINEQFISQIIDGQIEHTTGEIAALIKDIAQKSSNMDLESMQKYYDSLDTGSQDLIQLSSLLNKIIAKDQHLDSTESIQSLLNNKQLEFAELKRELGNEINNRRQLELERERLEKELELEREKNTYLRTSARNLSDDAKGLVHNIKIVSKKISSSVENLYDKIQNHSVTHKDILKALGIIRFQSEKILKISKIITRANFRTDKTDQIVDIVGYCEQYMSIYKEIYEDSNLRFVVNTNNSSLKRKISVLEMALIIDDLVSNSEKAGAKLFRMDIKNPEENKLEIIVSDDGEGVNEKFISDPEKIFELGVTTTNGSGIGLHSVRTALKSMNASIRFMGNGCVLRGASFEILFK